MSPPLPLRETSDDRLENLKKTVMKLTSIVSFLFLLLLIGGCEDEILLPDLATVEAPSELSLDFRITGDNTGTVTLLPGGRGVTAFSLAFGDGGATVEDLSPGESINHVYDEGVYTVTLEAMNINGKTTTYTEELTVSFLAPENLEVAVTPTAGNPLSIDVTATADLETNFLAYFGEDPDEDPVSFQEGETVSHEYGTTGQYELIVVARSGGAATIADTIMVTISNPVFLPLTFEDASKEYNFIGFGGATAEVVDNPDASGSNTSDRVARLTKQQDSETWAGVTLETGGPIDFSDTEEITMQVWSPTAGIPVLMKLENAGDADIFAELTVNTTVANQWETLTFDFSEADLTQDLSKVVLFFDFGNNGTGTDYYFDDIALAGLGPVMTLPLTFESADIAYEWSGFGGASAEIIDNPDASGANTSTRVGQLIKSEGSETWAGAVTELPEPIDFVASQQLSMKVWSPTAGIPVLLKVENGSDAGIFIEVTANTTVANQWEELTFDYTVGDLDQEYSKVAVFFDFGTAGTGATYYFDDIAQVGVGGGGEEPVVQLPLGFESTDLDYGLIGFGGAGTEIVDNPDATGANTSGRVGKLTKTDGSETWAGAVIELPQAIDFSGTQRLAMKVWSPKAGIPVALKVENAADGNIFIEIVQNTTVANQWEELIFDYSGGDLTQAYAKVVLFFDLGTAGDGSEYYFDDIRQAP